jgi:hypothetical protein
MPETAPTHLPERKTESVLKAIIDALSLGITAYCRFDDADDVDASRILILCEDATPEIIGETVTGNWTLEAQITVKTMRADVTGAAHDAMVAKISDVLFSSDIVSQLNGAGVEEFTAFSAYPGARRNSISDEQRETAQRVTIYMMPSSSSEE